MFNPLPVVIADMKRSRAGILAIITLIALAVGIGVAVSVQERALREGSAAAADDFDIVIGAPGSETQLVLSAVFLQSTNLELVDGSILADLQDNRHVAMVAPIGFGDSYRGYPIIGSTSEFITDGGTRPMAEGRPFETLMEVVVGADIPLEIGQTFVPVQGTQAFVDEENVRHGSLYVVAGRMPRLGNPWDEAIVASIESVWWLYNMPTGHAENAAIVAAGTDPSLTDVDTDAFRIGPPWDAEYLPRVPAILVKPKSFGGAYSLRAQYRAETTTAVFPAEVLMQLYAMLGDVADILTVVSILTQVLVVGAILLAVLATVTQRRRMIAVLRALGASRVYIFVSVWINVMAMILAGAVLGLFVGWGAAYVISQTFSTETNIDLPVFITLQEIGLVGTVIGLGVLLAAIPSFLLYRQPASSALKG